MITRAQLMDLARRYVVLAEDARQLGVYMAEVNR
jgi:hypothetical protein